MIDVIRPGALTTIQDRGRPGWARLGVPRSGALDQPALDRANDLVGNAAGSAGLETTLTGCALRFRTAALVAVTGALAEVTVDGVVVRVGAAVDVAAGSQLAIGVARAGVRSYLAVRGGVAVPLTLGSRSTDTLSGLGPRPLRARDTLPIGASSSDDDRCDPVGRSLSREGVATVRLRLGPRDDWFEPGSVRGLLGTPYTLSPKSNRVGARLAGEPLIRSRIGEFPSEGIVLGAVQVTADGQPVIFLADHPTTGGYPVIGVVDSADLPLLAQVRPGATVRFDGSQR